MKQRVIYLAFMVLVSNFWVVGQSVTFNKRVYFSNASLDGNPYSVFQTDTGFIMFSMVYVDSINNGWSSYGIYLADKYGDLVDKKFYGVWGRRHFGGIAGNFIKTREAKYTSTQTIKVDSTSDNFDISIISYDNLLDTVIGSYIELGKNEIARTLVQTTDNGFAIVGTQSEFNAIDPYVGKILLVKTDSSGNEQWHKTYNIPTQAFGLGITLAHDGGYVLSGAGFKAGKDIDTYIIKTDTSGNVEWMKNYGTVNFDGGGSAIQKTSDDSYIVKGGIDTFNLTATSGQKLWSNYIMKIDINGNMLWRYITNYNWYHQINMVREVAPGQGYIAVGEIYEAYFNGSNSVGILLRFDNDGNLLWVRRYASPSDAPNNRNGFASYSAIMDVQSTRDSGLICVGITTYNNPDLWLLKLDSNGCMGSYCGLLDTTCYYIPYPYCDDTLSVKDLLIENEIKVYPNPVTEEIKIVLQSTKHKIESVAMYNVTGRAMHGSITLTVTNATIDVRHLPNGLYFLHIALTNGQRVVRKVVKE